MKGSAKYNSAAGPGSRMERISTDLGVTLYVKNVHNVPVFKIQLYFAIFSTTINTMKWVVVGPGGVFKLFYCG